MIRRLIFVSLLAATPAFAQQGDRSDIDFSAPPPEWEIPPAPVLSPEEALEAFTLQPGFRIELVASEPLIQDPVAMDFDADGRIWVVEMQSFMPNVDGEGELSPVSRVVVLEDTDGDGRMDKSTTYMDNLILPRSIRVVAGGVLLGEPPNLWFTRDTDGDGRADEKILLTDNYSAREANPEHGANGLLYGLDNWIHDAMSDSGSFRYINGEWVNRPTVRRGQWGISHDDFGRHFTNNNSKYLQADFVPNHYYARNPNLRSQAGIFVAVDSDQSVHPSRITPGVNRRAHLDDDGFLKRFTAACAPMVYRGDAYPKTYYGNVFVAEPAAYFIRRSILREDENGVIRGDNAYKDEEFLTSTDERFRPVNLYTAPDGTLYVLDMYRGILQHRQFVTTYLRNQIIERGLEQPLGLGRIYRIVHEAREPGPAPKLSSASSKELVENLNHANGWWRDTSQRLLVERQDLSVVDSLREMALNHRNPVARIHALWTLEGLNSADPKTLLEALKHDHPQVRIAALRVSEGLLADSKDRELAARVAKLMSDKVAPVRVQAVFSVGEMGDARAKEEMLFGALQLHAAQPYIIEAVISGLQGSELAMLNRLCASSTWREEKDGRARAFSLLAETIMREGKPENINSLITLALSERPAWQSLAILKGIESSKITDLAERPAAIGQKPSEAIAKRANDVLGKLKWPGEGAEALPPELQLLADKGGKQYQLNCSACHGESGEGVEGLGKPLSGSEWVLGHPANLIRIVINGKEGQESLMPPLGAALTDENLAAILSHVRRSWGNEESFILPDDVAKTRAESTRTQPWTDEELRALNNAGN